MSQTQTSIYAELRGRGWHKIVNQKIALRPKFEFPIEAQCGLKIERYDEPYPHWLMIIAYNFSAPNAMTCKGCLETRLPKQEGDDVPTELFSESDATKSSQ